jgi:hypothetical protein
MACAVDALGKGAAKGKCAASGQGIVECGVAATAVEEAMRDAAVHVIPDDLACVIDAVRTSACGRQGIVDGGEGISRHVCGRRAVRHREALRRGGRDLPGRRICCCHRKGIYRMASIATGVSRLPHEYEECKTSIGYFNYADTPLWRRRWGF